MCSLESCTLIHFTTWSFIPSSVLPIVFSLNNLTLREETAETMKKLSGISLCQPKSLLLVRAAYTVFWVVRKVTGRPSLTQIVSVWQSHPGVPVSVKIQTGNYTRQRTPADLFFHELFLPRLNSVHSVGLYFAACYESPWQRPITFQFQLCGGVNFEKKKHSLSTSASPRLIKLHVLVFSMLKRITSPFIVFIISGHYVPIEQVLIHWYIAWFLHALTVNTSPVSMVLDIPGPVCCRTCFLLALVRCFSQPEFSASC